MKKPDVCLEVLSIVLLITIFVFAMMGEGKPVIPYFSFFSYLFFTALTRFSPGFDDASFITPQNRATYYSYQARLTRWFKFFVLLMCIQADKIYIPGYSDISRLIPVISGIAMGVLSLYYSIKIFRIDRV